MDTYNDERGIVQTIDKTIKASGQKTEVVLNEFIPFINDWCNCTGNEALCGNQKLPDNCQFFFCSAFSVFDGVHNIKDLYDCNG